MKGKTKCLMTAALASAMFTITVQNCFYQQCCLLSSVDGVMMYTSEDARYFTHICSSYIFEQRDPHLNQLESHKQDALDVPIKRNSDSINREILKQLVQHAKSRQYRIFLEQGLPELLQAVPIVLRKRLWFQHDGLPAYCSTAVSNFLDAFILVHWIRVRVSATPGRFRRSNIHCCCPCE